MKKLQVIAAGLGYGLLERNGMTEIAGLKFTPKASVFPAVTCVAQATLRTGLSPAEHGMISNGYWSEELQKPIFWEQSCRLVKGERTWSKKSGVFFFQQSLGEDVELIVSPAPIHKHGGGMIMGCYTKPTGMEPVLRKLCGKFPLWRYWGPLASPKVGRKCISYFEEMTNIRDVDEAYLYLPTLDYAAQKYGPDSSAAKSALKEFRKQLERIVDIAMHRGCELKVTGDYEITEVTAEPVKPNVILRREGFFRTRTVGGMSYPDFYSSTAFAMCDHEVAVIVGPERGKAAEILLGTGEFEIGSLGSIGSEELAESAGTANYQLPTTNYQLLLAKRGAWCGYEWWTNAREAPDFASHVDIHNKPGYDPKELFFFNRGVVKGTHGRNCEVAYA